jgi:hypothetical protein
MVVDPAQFNLGSLQLINASHAADVKISGNVVEFVFKQIYLNIGGHGHILLKLKTNAGSLWARWFPEGQIFILITTCP